MNKLNYDKKTVPFENIPIGGMFRYKQKVYMRIQSYFRMIGDSYNYELIYKSVEEYYNAMYLAVNLSNGEIDSFEWDTEVDVVKIDKIEIKTDT